MDVSLLLTELAVPGDVLWVFMPGDVLWVLSEFTIPGDVLRSWQKVADSLGDVRDLIESGHGVLFGGLFWNYGFLATHIMYTMTSELPIWSCRYMELWYGHGWCWWGLIAGCWIWFHGVILGCRSWVCWFNTLGIAFRALLPPVVEYWHGLSWPLSVVVNVISL